MAREIRYTIHFGNTASFRVHEWIYSYFNKVKNDPIKYNRLYNFLMAGCKIGNFFYKKIK